MTKGLLVTGATGFLGGAVIAELISTPYWPRVLMLVRARNRSEGRARIIENLQKFNVPAGCCSLVQDDQIMCADITRFDAIQSDPRLRSVSHVIHCAALATFSDNPRLWPINVEGTIALARILRTQSPLERFVHVGSSMACGMQAPSPVSESYDPGTQAIHAVRYTESKAACEERLRRELPDLPLVVVRPSIIVGHTRLGCRPSPSIFWVFRAAATLQRFTCDLDQRIDVIPVDYCANAIVHLALKRSLAFSLYHISAGPQASSTYGEICDALAPAISTRAAKSYRRVGYGQLAAMQNKFEGLFGPGNNRVLLRALRLYGEFAALGITFSNDRSIAEGVALPTPFARYAELCARTACNSSVFEQMKSDFKGASFIENATVSSADSNSDTPAQKAGIKPGASRTRKATSTAT